MNDTAKHVATFHLTFCMAAVDWYRAALLNTLLRSGAVVGVVIFIAKRQPSDRKAACIGPLREERGLAVTRGSRHQHALVLVNFSPEEVNQPGAGHQVMWLRRDL